MGDGDCLRDANGRRYRPYPTYPLQIAGFTFPGYTALFTVILNIAVAAVLTPVFNAIGAQRMPFDVRLSSSRYKQGRHVKLERAALGLSYAASHVRGGLSHSCQAASLIGEELE